MSCQKPVLWFFTRQYTQLESNHEISYLLLSVAVDFFYFSSQLVTDLEHLVFLRHFPVVFEVRATGHTFTDMLSKYGGMLLK